MIDRKAARKIVEAELQKAATPWKDDELVILDDQIIEFEFGWVFPYASKMFLESGSAMYMLWGNAPYIVDKENGSLHLTGTAKSIEEYVDDYRKGRIQNSTLK